MTALFPTKLAKTAKNACLSTFNLLVYSYVITKAACRIKFHRRTDRGSAGFHLNSLRKNEKTKKNLRYANRKIIVSLLHICDGGVVCNKSQEC